MSTVDPFGRTDKLDNVTLENLVRRFEARGKNQQFSKMLHEYLDAMHIDDANAVLDMGCGTGLAARTIALRPRFTGKVTGIDLSPYLIAAADRLAHEEGLTEHLEFRVGDVKSVDFEDRVFDAIVVHTLLSHVDEPLAVLKQAARILKDGGMIGIFDGDYASLTFNLADFDKGKAYDEALISAVVTNPGVMRQMPRLLRAAGLELITSFSYVLSEVGTANYWASAIETYRKLMQKAGVMTEEDANEWASELRRDSQAGIFFGSCNYYTYVARRS
jgi:ubiquinone/menaquinone biosynthesis C-methylase UbiE